MTSPQVTGILITHLLKPAGYGEEGVKGLHPVDPKGTGAGTGAHYESQSHWMGSFSAAASSSSHSTGIGGPLQHSSGKAAARSSSRLDARVVDIVTEMVDAIELSIWDAALDKNG